MIKEAIKKLVAGNDLTFDEAAQVMDEMFSGTATQSQMAAYLTALRIKGETIDENYRKRTGYERKSTPHQA